MATRNASPKGSRPSAIRIARVWSVELVIGIIADSTQCNYAEVWAAVNREDCGKIPTTGGRTPASGIVSLIAVRLRTSRCEDRARSELVPAPTAIRFDCADPPA